MITCALLSRCSGSLSLIATSWALAGFWARKGVCPWWTVVVPLKNFCPRATVASAHASLNRSCSVVELFQALVLCFYQLQAAAVVVGRSAAQSSNGGCEAQAAVCVEIKSSTRGRKGCNASGLFACKPKTSLCSNERVLQVAKAAHQSVISQCGRTSST